MSLKITHNTPLTTISLNRPEIYNSFNREMSLALISSLEELGSDLSVRAILLTGEGKAFCAGQDLAEAVEDNGVTVERAIEEHYNPIILAIRNCPKPIISVVNGTAAGAGANIALACDVCVAAESASFIQAFSKIGLIPDCGGTFTLPRLIGFGKASALMMLGDKVTAREAERMGMIYKVFADDTYRNDSAELATTLANMPTKALALTKELLNKSFTNSFDEQLNQEKILQVKSADTSDAKEGIKAFLEKRKPKFTGK